MTTRETRRLMLLRAARDVVLRFGYRKTTLDDIAHEAGVSRATLYNYFSSKNELVRQIIALEIAHLRDAMARAIDPQAPPEEQLQSLVRARYAHLRSTKALYQVVMGIARDVLPVARAELQSFHDEQVGALSALLQQGMDSGRFRLIDPHLFARALLSALRGLDEAYMFDDEESAADGALALLDVLIDGLLLRQEADA